MGAEPKQTGGSALIYVTTVLYAVLSMWGVYTAFIVAGALVGTLIEGQLRFAIAIALALLFPLLTAMGFSNTSKEHVRGIETLNRILMATAILSIGTAIIVGVAATGKVVPNMQTNPNWFLTDPYRQDGFPKTNRRYHMITSNAFCTIAHKVGTYYCPN